MDATIKIGDRVTYTDRYFEYFNIPKIDVRSFDVQGIDKEGLVTMGILDVSLYQIHVSWLELEKLPF